MKKNRKDGLFRRGDSLVWYCWIRGVRCSTGFTDAKAALARKADLERLAADPVAQASEMSDLLGAVGDFLDRIKDVENKPAATVLFYKKKCAALLKYFGEGRSLASLAQPSVWDRYIQDRLQNVSRNTVGHELVAARRVLKLARRNKAFPFLMEDVFPERFQREYEPKTRALSGEEIGKLLAALDATSPLHAGFTAWAIATASRKGEVERAEAIDVSADGSVVQIRGTKTKLSKGAIPIAPAFRELLLWAVARGAKTGPLFGHWANPSRDLAAACRRAGIELRCTTNDLRRTHASLLRDAGVETRAIAAVLRHASTRMVEQVYAPTGGGQAAPLVERADFPIGLPERSLVARQSDSAPSARSATTASEPNSRVSCGGHGISNPLVRGSNPRGRASFSSRYGSAGLSLAGRQTAIRLRYSALPHPSIVVPVAVVRGFGAIALGAA